MFLCVKMLSVKSSTNKECGLKKGDNDKLQAQLKSYQTLETELVDVHVKNSDAHERISKLEQQLEESTRRHGKEMSELKQANAAMQAELRQKRQELANEALRTETLSADCARLKVEMSRVEAHRQRAESLERELAEAKAAVTAAKVHKTEYDTLLSRRVVESGEKFEVEIKVLNNQVANLVSLYLSEFIMCINILNHV